MPQITVLIFAFPSLAFRSRGIPCTPVFLDTSMAGENVNVAREGQVKKEQFEFVFNVDWLLDVAPEEAWSIIFLTFFHEALRCLFSVSRFCAYLSETCHLVFSSRSSFPSVSIIIRYPGGSFCNRSAGNVCDIVLALTILIVTIGTLLK